MRVPEAVGGGPNFTNGSTEAIATILRLGNGTSGQFSLVVPHLIQLEYLAHYPSVLQY